MDSTIPIPESTENAGGGKDLDTSQRRDQAMRRGKMGGRVKSPLRRHNCHLVYLFIELQGSESSGGGACFELLRDGRSVWGCSYNEWLL